MDSVRDWALSVCAASVTSGIIVFLIPEGSMKKIAQYVITVFMLLVSVLPIAGDFLTDFELPEFSVDGIPAEEDYLSDYENFVSDASSRLVEQEIRKLLEDVCKDRFSVSVTVLNDEDGNAVLSDVHIAVSEKDYSSYTEIRTKVGSLTGIIPKITAGD